MDQCHCQELVPISLQSKKVVKALLWGEGWVRLGTLNPS